LKANNTSYRHKLNSFHLIRRF
jgi:hypothetical protein